MRCCHVLLSTAAAGAACGAQYGVASNCKLCSVKVVKDDEQQWIDGINFVRDTCTVTKSLCVVNFGFFASAYTEAMKEAIISAIDAGIVVVTNAGYGYANACVGSEQAIEKAITVGLTEWNDEKRADSNFGPCVDVYAPGKGIYLPGLQSSTHVKIFDEHGESCKFQRELESLVPFI